MRAGTWNVRGLKPKKIQVEQAIQEMQLDIVCLQETLANEKNPARIDGMQVWSSEAGRGLAIGLRREFVGKLVGEPSEVLMTVRACNSYGSALICCVYVPHDRTRLTMDTIGEKVRQLRRNNEPLFLLG
ncbi:MAG: uncharacterized protein A8A55_2617, partial [Amphiamblys sp. WSBS2006]